MKIKKINKQLVKKIFPKRTDDSNKYNYGKLLIISGSYPMAGACFFCSKSAMRSGCGMVYVSCIDKIKNILSTLFPQAIYYSYGTTDFIDDRFVDFILKLHSQKNFDLLLIGPGLGNSDIVLKSIYKILKKLSLPCVIDADAITSLSVYGLDFLKEFPTIITPHYGEAKRISNKKNHIDMALDISEKTGGVVVLKDFKTIICNGKTIFENDTKNSALSKAGSGDVLCGIISGLWSNFKRVGFNNETAFKSAICGVYIHSICGLIAREKLSSYSVLASDLIDLIPLAIKKIYERR